MHGLRILAVFFIQDNASLSDTELCKCPIIPAMFVNGSSARRVRQSTLVLALPRRACYAGQVKDVTSENFGLLIAYLLPGFILLWSLAPYSATVTTWLGQAAGDQPTVGGFLYVTLASVGLGLIVSTVRWMVIDSLLHVTGIRQPRFDFSNLRDAVEAFNRLIEIHFRYYQWHANSRIALLIAASLRCTVQGFRRDELLWLIVALIVLYPGSRDTLRKYYRRVDDLLRRDR